jgi:DNA repair exonuclease SbcCD ATPase subunit
MSGFVDLRLNRRRSIDEGFWPSFTDIMTVIVMIFLMGMVVVLLQNMEVTNNMKSALLEKQKATELAKSTFEEKSKVSHQLSDAEEELARLRMMIILANDQRKTMQQQLSSVSQELQSLTGMYATLEETNKNVLQEKEAALKDTETALKEKQKADVALEEKSQALARIESQLNTLVEQQTILTSELASSRQAQELSEQKLEAVTLQASSADQELASIRGEYSDLQVKYNKLIKPARTSKGKYVVEVFYSKDGNKDVYKVRDSGQSSSAVVSQKELHQQLAKLKQQHEKNLYIRLIFPEDSKLSYNDAWTFSKEILGKYDYYHTD